MYEKARSPGGFVLITRLVRMHLSCPDFPRKTKAAPVSISWALVAFLVSRLGLSLPSLHRPPFVLRTPRNIICMLIRGVFVFPLWAGVSSGVRPPAQQHGWHFPFGSVLVQWWSLKHPGSGTGAGFSLNSLSRVLCAYLKCTTHLLGTNAVFPPGTPYKHTVPFVAAVSMLPGLGAAEGTTFIGRSSRTRPAWHLPIEDRFHPNRFTWVRRSRLSINCLCVE